MSDHDVPPLDADVRALLESARGIAPVPGEVSARLLARVEAVVLPPVPGGGGGSGGGGGGAGPGASIGPSQLGVLRRLLPLVAAFAVGGAVGAGAMRAAAPSAPPILVAGAPSIVYVERPAPSVPVADVPSPLPTASTVARPPAVASVGVESGLAAERALLDVARGAIERQDGAAALAAIREHERRFPAGMLVQEREAMTVRALLLLGKRDEARARTERFRTRFPGSVLTPALEGQVGAPAASP